MKRSPLKRRTPLRRRRPWLSGAGENRELRATFRTRVLMAGACLCTGRGDCAGPLEAHHAVSKEAIKGVAKARGWSTPRLHAELWNPDNGVAVCRRHHDLHTRAISRIPLELLPGRVILFAEGLRLRHRLEREYWRPTRGES